MRLLIPESCMKNNEIVEYYLITDICNDLRSKDI